MKQYFRTYLSILLNFVLALAVYFICRVAFLLDNWSQFSMDMTWQSFFSICRGGLWFDTSAICYTGLLYLLLALIPLQGVRWWHVLTKWSFFFPNALAVILNLGDAVYYPYGHHRITTRVFNEFGNEDNLGKIFGVEFLHHWYFVLLAAVMIFALWKLYRPSCLKPQFRKVWKDVLASFLSVAFFGVWAITGIRVVSLFVQTRPIAMSNAHEFVNRPSEANIVLNTPFSLIRTISKRPPKVPHYFDDPAMLDAVFNPVHMPADSSTFRAKNVVILIVESFATEFIGALNNNRSLDNGTYRGYTEFIDSLIPSCLTFERTIANTNVSIDAMPAILASIPRMEFGFFVSPYSLNHITSFATELKNHDYATAFFHGGHNESMGFQAFARGAGFDEYYGMTEYCEDPRFGGKKDFDGTWAIWDEEFLQFYALKMSEMKEPFMTGVFTASSHHPFALPERYKSVYPEEGQFPLHKCIRYTDNALRQFFATARKQPWFENTIFVITADHSSSRRTHDEYKTDAGDNHVPILFYDPSGEMPRGVMPGIMQQLDILPTVLGWLGYDRPFISMGNDALNTPEDKRWAFNRAQIPTLYMGDYYIQTDEDCNATGLYNYKTDILMKHDLKEKLPARRDSMETMLKAIIQSYMERMEAESMRIER